MSRREVGEKAYRSFHGRYSVNIVGNSFNHGTYSVSRAVIRMTRSSFGSVEVNLPELHVYVVLTSTSFDVTFSLMKKTTGDGIF